VTETRMGSRHYEHIGRGLQGKGNTMTPDFIWNHGTAAAAAAAASSFTFPPSQAAGAREETNTNTARQADETTATASAKTGESDDNDIRPAEGQTHLECQTNASCEDQTK
jgi:type IV secretory pathway TrbL component